MMNRSLLALGFCATVFTVGAAAQTNVTTSGSTSSGSIPVFNATATVTNSPIEISGGNVGIGTTAPVAKFQVSGGGFGDLVPAIFTTSDFVYPTTGSMLWLQFGAASGNTYSGIGAYSSGGSTTNNLILNWGGGNVGIGTTSPGANNKLEVNGNIALTASSGASLTFQDGTTQSTAWTGTVCGGDYAEDMRATGNKEKYEPGDVLVLAPGNDSDVQKSDEPYSVMVAGIYATKPGVVGRRDAVAKSAENIPMAMVGVVPTKVSAENGPIHKGDLLVTSSVQGYAMKGTDRGRMLGAVIGKAMGSLDSGTGVIEVLVTLQ